MSYIEHPSEDTPRWQEHSWKVEVFTSAYYGEVQWTHLLSMVPGGEAWRVASAVGDTFKCPVRIVNEFDNSLTFTSKG